jgi:hypothetical protein
VLARHLRVVSPSTLALHPVLPRLIFYVAFADLAAGQTPPGVYPSPDGADVAAPISLFEWLLNFYEEARESKVSPAALIAYMTAFMMISPL